MNDCGTICCGLASVVAFVPIFVVMERRAPGLGLLLLAAGVLVAPLALWDQLDGTVFEPLGVRLALWTAALGHDLVAAFLPRWPVPARLMIGALLFGGWMGAGMGLFLAMYRARRAVTGLFLGATYAFFGMALLRQGPSPVAFSPGGLDWPAFEVPMRPRPLVPLRPSTRAVSAGKVRLLTLPPYGTERVGGRTVTLGDCTIVARDTVFAGEPVTAGLWRAVLGEDPPGCDRCAPTEPVRGVSWYGALDFANRASAAWGLVPPYEIDGKKVTWKLSANGLRLPTEAEWELATGGETADQEWVWDAAGERSCGDDPAYATAQKDRVVVSKAVARVTRRPQGGRAASSPTDGQAGLRLVR